MLEAREETPGALNDAYDVPRVEFTRTASALWVTLAALAITLLAYRHLVYGQETLILLPLWLAGFGMRVIPLAISWFDKPFKVSRADQAYLDKHLVVIVAVPCYNEDPALLDRCLWALVNQTRPPNAIHVVDDGSPNVDYTVLRDYWTQDSIPVRIHWTTQPENGGKKVAQSVVFMSHPEADIFATVDSDTSLERNAIHEGLKPFADDEIMSVAGVEENYNKNVNWLTRSVAARNTYYQLTVWAAQSVRRDLLVNRGTFALYRAWIIRECVPCYIGETFLGRRIKLGDDAALTLFCRWYGKTVQQVSAFCLPVQPETFSHHFRQWTRWARGAVIRNCWRLRYLPVRSYGFIWTMMVWYMIFMSAAMPVVFAITWPQSEHVLEFAAVSILAWTYMVAPKVCQVRREGETWLYRLRSVLIYPTGIMWATLVLRPVRLYGVVTFFKQRWTTRQHGIEELTVPVGVHDLPPKAGVAALRPELEAVT